MLWSVPADRVHSRRELYSSSRQCGTKPPARRDPLQCLGKLLRKGYTTAERFAAPRANAVPRPPARWDPLPRFGQYLRKWANSHGMGYLCLLPGGAAWRAMALREGIQRGHQMGSHTAFWTVPAEMGQQPLHGLPLFVAGRGSLEVVGPPGGHPTWPSARARRQSIRQFRQSIRQSIRQYVTCGRQLG